VTGGGANAAAGRTFDPSLRAIFSVAASFAHHDAQSCK
jgi:hypothetical protein